MKRYELTRAQRAMVKDALSEVHDTDGEFCIAVELHDLNVVARGWVSIEGYTEDDTDAWVETGRAADVRLNGYTECEEVELDPVSERMIQSYMMTE